MAATKISKLDPPKPVEEKPTEGIDAVEQAEPSEPVLEEPPVQPEEPEPVEEPYPIVIQRFKPQGIEIEFHNAESLTPRKLEAGLLHSFKELRRSRRETIQRHMREAQVAPTAQNEVRATQEDKPWQPEQDNRPPENPELKALQEQAIAQAKESTSTSSPKESEPSQSPSPTSA